MNVTTSKTKRKTTSVFFGLMLCVVVASHSAFSQTGKVFPTTALLEKLWGDGNFTEGVAAAPDGTVYFCDMTVFGEVADQASYIYKFDPRTKQTTVFRAPSNHSNGLKFGADGEMYTVQINAGGTRNVFRTDLRTGRVYNYASRYNNKAFNSLNDLTIDNQGRLYVTDPRNIGEEPIEQPFFGVYRIDRDRTVTPVIVDLLAPNGIAVSPDNKTLYVADHPYTCNDIPRYKCQFRQMSVKAYDLNSRGGATFRKTLVDFGVSEGADGIIVDAEGNLYAAVRDEKRKGICVYNPNGEEIDRIPTPEKPTNVGFGRGAERNALYITAGKSLYRVQTMKQGYELPTQTQ